MIFSSCLCPMLSGLLFVILSSSALCQGRVLMFCACCQPEFASCRIFASSCIAIFTPRFAPFFCLFWSPQLHFIPSHGFFYQNGWFHVSFSCFVMFVGLHRITNCVESSTAHSPLICIDFPNAQLFVCHFFSDSTTSSFAFATLWTSVVSRMTSTNENYTKQLLLSDLHKNSIASSLKLGCCLLLS